MMSEIHGRIDETMRAIEKTYNIDNLSLLKALKLFTLQWDFELKKEALNAMKREINSDCSRDALLCHLSRIEDFIHEE